VDAEPDTSEDTRDTTAELADFARLTGNDNLHDLNITDLCTTNSEISSHTQIQHV